MPFTLAHAAAALPFRRWRLVPSALVVGTFAPDFEYLLRFSARGRFGHTLAGSFLLSLPLALLVLWIFHAFVMRPTVALLPEAFQRRLQDHLNEFRFGGASRFVLIVASILLGIATHLLWDSFTHSATWPYRHWSVLRQPFTMPIVGPIPLYKILQHGSTIAGIGILAAWLVLWYRTAQPSAQFEKSLSSRRKAAVIAVVTTVALVGAVARALSRTGVPSGHSAFNKFVVQATVTAMALVWWQLVAYGFAAKSTLRERQL
ncbi:MAG: DUF4184 family protein [Candidatus Sulfotelmatobacter sp.]